MPRRPRTALPVQRASSVAVPPRRRRSRLRAALAGAAGVLVPAAVLGGVLLAGPDGAAVFGSDVVRAQPGESVAVSTLFGSVQVVVPDGARVDTSGMVVFGEGDCDDACRGTGDPVIEVRRLGAFGSIEVVTEGELQADEREDRDDD